MQVQSVPDDEICRGLAGLIDSFFVVPVVGDDGLVRYAPVDSLSDLVERGYRLARPDEIDREVLRFLSRFRSSDK